MSTSWVTHQILSIRRTAEPTRIAKNPKPAGVMLPGSATHAVWVYLESLPHRRWVQRRQIVTGTGCTGKAVDWALIFLLTTGRIERSSDDMRCSRYYRYRKADSSEARHEPGNR